MISESDIPSLFRTTAEISSNMNFSLTSVYISQKPFTMTKLPAVLCDGDPFNFPSLTGTSSKIEPSKDTDIYQSSTDISVSRLLDHSSLISRPFLNTGGHVLCTSFQSGKRSIMEAPKAVSYPVPPASVGVAQPAEYGTFQSREKHRTDPFRRCTKSSKECSNCHQTHSPNWYLSKDKYPLCNACAKYQKRTGLPRPPQHWNKEVRCRRRKVGSGEGMVLKAIRTTSVCNNNREQYVDSSSTPTVKKEIFDDIKVAKRRKKEDCRQTFCTITNNTICSNLGIENDNLAMNTQQISPRRSELFDMEHNKSHSEYLGNWDKMTSLLSVVRLAKYQGDFVLNVVAP